MLKKRLKKIKMIKLSIMLKISLIQSQTLLNKETKTLMMEEEVLEKTQERKMLKLLVFKTLAISNIVAIIEVEEEITEETEEEEGEEDITTIEEVIHKVILMGINSKIRPKNGQTMKKEVFRAKVIIIAIITIKEIIMEIIIKEEATTKEAATITEVDTIIDREMTKNIDSEKYRRL